MKHNIVRSHIIGTTLLLIITGAGLFVLVLIARSVEAKIVATHDITAKLSTYERNRTQYNKQSEQVKDLQKRIDLLSTYVITTATVPSLLSELETFANDRGVNFKITSVDTPIDSKKQKKLQISFTAQGSLEAVQAFLSDIKEQPFLVQFRSFSLALATTYSGIESTKKPFVQEWQTVASIEIVSFTQ